MSSAQSTGAHLVTLPPRYGAKLKISAASADPTPAKQQSPSPILEISHGVPRLLAVVLLVLAASPQGLAADIHVPLGTTIQAGIDSASPGDVVIVADGTHTGPGNRDLDFLGKAITVRSASGNPTLCIIECQSLGRGFHFRRGETSDSVVQGFTIRGGLTNSILWGNTATPDTNQTIYSESGTIDVSYSDVQGGYPGIGNIDADPMFVNEIAGDLRLAGRACVDRGDNTAVAEGVTTDLGGNPRITGGIVDMGAYEAPRTIGPGRPGADPRRR